MFVIGDVVVNIFTLGYGGIFACAKQDYNDRRRYESLILELLPMPKQVDLP